MTDTPQLFLSYAWSTPEHMQWVEQLANDLASNGIHVHFDQWDLQEGHDINVFMERTVNDPSISKVALVCDRVYAEKANQRRGGVGTEARIISSEVYESSDQEKFVALAVELDQNGKPYLPTFIRSRKYIDFTESARYTDKVAELTYWAFGKRVKPRPKLGQRPSYLDDTPEVQMGTSLLARSIDAHARNGHPALRGATDEYFERFAHGLGELRFHESGEDIAERVVQSIGALLPARNEFIGVLETLVRYAEPDAYLPSLHRFFEGCMASYGPLPGARGWDSERSDNVRFLVPELFLYAIACMLKQRHLKAAEFLLSERYLAPVDNRAVGASVGFTAIQEYVQSVDMWNRSQPQPKQRPHAFLLKERAHPTVKFDQLMQADFVCFLRSTFVHRPETWYPETLTYVGNRYAAFDLFARAESKRFAEQVVSLVGAADVQAFKERIQHFAKHPDDLPRIGGGMMRMPITAMTGVESFGSIP